MEGRQHDQWWHTAHLICAIVEPQRDSKKRSQPYTPADFYPFKDRLPSVSRRPTTGTIEVLRAFLPRQA